MRPENDYRHLAAIDPGAPSLRVCVVIPAYERAGLLRRTLGALAAQRGYPADLVSVVVADDGSTEDVAAAVSEAAPGAGYVRREHDGYGAGPARNLGAARTDADVLLFLDADCLPVPDLVARHMDWHHRSPDVAVIGSRHFADTASLDPAAPGFPAALREMAAAVAGTDDWRATLYRRTLGLVHGTEAFRAFLSGNVSVSRRHFDAAGGFSERFRHWGGEDTELGWRLFQRGLLLVPEDRAAVFHQTQQDAGPERWREAGRAENEALLRSLVPHPFYRPEGAGGPFDVPKVSWVIAPAAGERAADLFSHLDAQEAGDWEAWFPLDPGFETADPRLRRLPDAAGTDDQRILRAIAAAGGEHVALLSGAAAPSPGLQAAAVARLDASPRVSVVTVGTIGSDPAAADLAWGVPGLPAFALTRRREWSKALAAHAETAVAWAAVLGISRTRFVGEPLIAFPSPEGGVPRPPGGRNGRSTVGILRRALRRSIGRRSGLPPVIAHLGDPADADRLASMAGWARVVPERRARAVVISGLLDDDLLDRFLDLDDPRVERITLGVSAGTGTPAAWTDVLRTCLEVGVASSDDVGAVRALGYGGPVTVTGRLRAPAAGAATILERLREALA
jgi:GT2 family glycosyltransferase